MYIWFRLRAGHRQGRGVHPPYAYDFVSRVIFGADVGGLEGIESLREKLLARRERLQVSDLGAGPHAGKHSSRSIRRLVKGTAVSPRKGKLLGRIARHLGFLRIVELGTGTGISSLYLGIACPHSTVLTCEGCPAIAGLARDNIRSAGASNIQVSNMDFRDWLPGVLEKSGGELLVFIDGDHRGERMLGYCSMILESGIRRTVLVLDDIHWSPDMYRAWKLLTEREEISLSLELYNTGIAFSGFDVQRDRFIVNF